MEKEKNATFKKCFERIGGIEMKQRIPEIDVLRGLGIFFVLLGHAIIVYPIMIIPGLSGSSAIIRK